MFLTRHHYRVLLVVFLAFILITIIDGCNIWKASDCPQPPTADDEEIVGYIHTFLHFVCLFVSNEQSCHKGSVRFDIRFSSTVQI
jgi:hypothetical protein